VTFRGPRNDDQHAAQVRIIQTGIRQGFDANNYPTEAVQTMLRKNRIQAD